MIQQDIYKFEDYNNDELVSVCAMEH